MLAPRAYNAFVCFRCELQLARRRLPAYTRRPSHANFSTSARLQDGADELDALSQAPTAGPRIRREVEPLNRVRRRKGKVIRETSARLGNLKTLGDDADILVLREVDQDDKPSEPTEKPAPAEPIEVPDIIASIQQERQTLTPEEVRNRLETLRPKTRAEPGEPHYVTSTAFKKLMHGLTHGFTQQQLAHYYSAAKNIEQGSYNKKLLNSLKVENGASKSLITRTEWQPGDRPIGRRLPGVDVTTRPRRAPVSKQLLVDRIIRDLWTLVPLEEVEAPGQIELSLKPWHLALLSIGETETILNKISRERKARLEIFQPHSVLRITADKSTAEYAANDVEEALHNTEVKKLQLKPWIPCLQEDKVPKDKKLAALYSQEDFDMVTSLTRASIQRMDNANTLVIRGLGKSAVAEAERTLIRLLPLKDSTLHTTESQKLDAARGSGHLVPTSIDEKSLDHKYRGTKLGRWSFPVSRSAKDNTNEGQDLKVTAKASSNAKPADDNTRVARVLKSLQHPTYESSTAQEENVKNREIGYWVTRPEVKLSAEFGHALYPMDASSSGQKTKVGDVSSTQSVFAPNTLGLTSLLTAAHVQGEKHGSEPAPSFQAISRTESPSLLYEFIASPDQQHFEAGQTFPSLHIQMRTSRTGGKAVLHKLSLGFQQHIHDVLLPDKAADVRFVRYGRLRFKKSHHHTNVTEWTNAVCENIASGERLTAPPLTIEIPKWTIPGHPANAKGLCHVTYLFSGVRFRQAVVGTYLDAQVSYSTIQSGKLGARGGSLQMFYSGEGQSTQAIFQDEDNLRSFVEKTFSMVDTITEAAAQSQPALKMLRPRASDSERKARRQAVESEKETNRLVEESERKAETLEEEPRRLAPDSPWSDVGTAADVEKQDTLEAIIEDAKDEVRVEEEGKEKDTQPETENMVDPQVAKVPTPKGTEDETRKNEDASAEVPKPSA